MANVVNAYSYFKEGDKKTFKEGERNKCKENAIRESIQLNESDGKVYRSDRERESNRGAITMEENHRGQRKYSWKGVRWR